ncbi:MAG: preprotein translocase subunit SecG [Terricaulis sp.]
MELAVLVLHLVVCVCLIGLVLLQRSEGGALGMGGGGGSLMSGRGAADALARMTSIAGGFFLMTSLSLTVISGANASRGPSPLDIIPSQQQPATLAPEAPAPVRPDPTESSAPQATETELAALTAPSAPNVVGAPVAPPAAQASERAGPLASNTQQASARPPVVQRPATPPAQRATTPPGQRAATPTVQRPVAQTVAATQRPAQRPAAQTPAAAQRAPGLVLPNSSGAAGLAETAPTTPESVDVGGGLEAVRRERAGPDQ